VSSDRAAPAVSWEQLVAMTPQVIRQAVPMVPWNVRKLHSLDLPIQPVAVDDLAWLFDLPLWQKNGTRFQVSPAQVRADPAKFADHMRRVMASGLEHPIHLIEHNGRLVVLDGYHRLLKAAIQGRAQIEAMVLSQQNLRSICTR
jgi:ParB-like nuclease domain